MFKYPFAKTYPISQYFGENPQMYPKTNGHNGLDIAVPINTPVFSITAGKITDVRVDTNGYGLHIRQQIDKDGLIIYAHLNDVYVQKGQWIEAGYEIGKSGNTGWSTGPHLHLEYRPDGKNAVDILPMLEYSAVPTNTIENNQGQKPALSKTVKVISKDGLRIRLTPMFGDNIRGLLNEGDILSVVDIDGEWVGVKVWVHSNYLENAE